MSIAKSFFALPMLMALPGAVLMAQHGGGSAGHAGGSIGHVSGMHSVGGGLTGVHPAAVTPTLQGSTGFPASAYSIGIPASAYSLGLPPSISGNRTGYPAYRANRYSFAGGRRGRNGYGYGYGYPYYPYYPLWGFADDTDSSSYPPYAADYPAMATAPDESGAVGEQLAQLSAQVNDLQYQLSQGSQARQNPYAPQTTAAPQDPPPPSPPLIVVLTNSQTLHVQNYAVMGNWFWDFSSQPVRKIPLSQIDVPASTKATEATGAEFPPITSLAKAPGN